MKRNEYELLNELKENSYKVIDRTMLMPYLDDRTLLFGYTCDRTTWHVYMKDTVIHTVTYKSSEEPVEHLVNSNYDFIPDKRLYPEACDYYFCEILQKLGFELIFLPWNDEREKQQFYGKILASAKRVNKATPSVNKLVKNFYFALSGFNSLSDVEIMTVRDILSLAFFDAELDLELQDTMQISLKEIKDKLFKDIYKGDVVFVRNFNKMSPLDKGVVYNLLKNGLVESIRENEKRLSNAISSLDDNMVIEFYEDQLLCLNKVKEILSLKNRIKVMHYKKLLPIGFSKGKERV